LVKVNPFTLILFSFFTVFTQNLLSMCSDCVQLLLRF
jgi:hypothetical protein